MQIKGNIVVLGASSNPNRVSYMATKLLKNKGYNLKAFGNRKGKIENIEVETELNNIKDKVDAITVFLKPDSQKKYYNYILDQNPTSLIFNPGTENPELEALAKLRNIKIISCCTIALLTVNML
jgi:uncharacterized protein